MWRTFGQDRAVGILRRSMEEGRLSHAYLFSGPAQVGKMSLAMDLARALNCTGEDRPCGACAQCSRIDRGLHTDLKIVGLASVGGSEGRGRTAISIEQVREAQREAALKPFEGSSRVFIFDDAERLSAEAANCLLKTLEEPPDQVVLVLLASDQAALLPTLVSRCQLLRLRPVPRAAISLQLSTRYELDADSADRIARLSLGRPGWAIQAATGDDILDDLSERLANVERLAASGLEERFSDAARLATSFSRDRGSVREELDTWLRWWRDALLVKEGLPDAVVYAKQADALEAAAEALTSSQLAHAVRAIRETIDLLERNVNARLALEGLMLELPRLDGLAQGRPPVTSHAG